MVALCVLDTVESTVESLDEEDGIVIERESHEEKNPLAITETDIFPIIHNLQE